jgi:hypothetical protein
LILPALGNSTFPVSPKVVLDKLELLVKDNDRPLIEIYPPLPVPFVEAPTSALSTVIAAFSALKMIHFLHQNL